MFFTLFGAVAVVGVLGAGIMSTMRGPLTTMVEVNRIEETKAEMAVGLRLILLTPHGTADGDVLTEPAQPDACTVAPTGAGCIPAAASAKKKDAWGTLYAYCAWNNGSDHTALGRILSGGVSTNNVAVALISAGPDRQFQTTCANGPTFITPSDGGGDDIIRKYNYNDAVAGSDGLWALQSGADGDEARIEEEINVGGGTGAVSTFEGGARFGNNLTTTGNVQADVVGPNPDGAQDFVEFTNGILLGDTDTCTNGMLRIRSSKLELCLGGTWDEVGKALWIEDGAGMRNDPTLAPNVGVGTSPSSSYSLYVNGGAATDTLKATSTVDFDATLNVDGAVTLKSTAGIDGAATLGSTLDVTGATKLADTLEVSKETDLFGDLTVESDVFIKKTAGGKGNLTVEDKITATEGDITATAGHVVATAGNVVATAGNVEATAGNVTAGKDITAQDNITATSGNIAATAGNVTAGGDITANGKMTGGSFYRGADNRDFSDLPTGCDAGNEKLAWTATGWRCDEIDFSGDPDDGSNGLALKDVLGYGNDADGRDAEDFGKIGADEYCDAGLGTCISSTELISGSQIWKKDGPGGASGEIYYSGGNVGIGTNDPVNMLDVQGNVGISGGIAVGSGAIFDTSTLVVNATDNRVGVLNATPQAAFDVAGTMKMGMGGEACIDSDGIDHQGSVRYVAADYKFEVCADEVKGWEDLFKSGDKGGLWQPDDGGKPFIEYDDALGGIRVGKVAGDAPVAGWTVDAANSIVFTNGKVGANEYCAPDGTSCFDPSVLGNVASSLFWMNDGPGGASKIYYSGGNVGIGIDDPTTKLHVRGTEAYPSADSTVLVQNTAAGGSGSAWLSLFASDASGFIGVFGSTAHGVALNDSIVIGANSTASGGIVLYNGDHAKSVYHRASTGNFGIGVHQPVTRLDVLGTVKIGDGTELCNVTAHEGAIKYDATTDEFYVCRNSSTGWEPIGSGSGSDTLADLSCTSGQVAQWNGTVWACANMSSGGGGGGPAITVQTFTVNGTWTKPIGVTRIEVYATGGGGGGGSCAGGGCSGSGGGAGGTAICVIDATSISSAPIVVGAGGSKGTGGSAGSTGNASSFNGAGCSATGGGGGAATNGTAGAGGTASGGEINIAGGGGGTGSGGVGGSSYWGGGGQSPGTGIKAGNAGVAFGSGGSGGSGNNAAGGDGKGGIVFIKEYYGGGGDGTDTLAGLSCASGQVASWNGTAWTCADMASGSVGPSFHVHKNGSNQSILANTGTVLTWSAESFDTNNNFASDRFTPTVAGKYILNASLWFNTLPATNGGYVSIRKNGTTIATGSFVPRGGSTSGNAGSNAVIIADANGATDYFDVIAYQNSAGSADVLGTTGMTYFSGSFLGGGSGSGTDTLAALSCSSGQVASWNGTAWACADMGSGDGGGGWVEVPLNDTANYDLNCQYRATADTGMQNYPILMTSSTYFYHGNDGSYTLRIGAANKAQVDRYNIGTNTLNLANAVTITKMEKNCGGGGSGGGSGAEIYVIGTKGTTTSHNSGAGFKVTGLTEAVDTANAFSGDTFTAPETGYYFLSGTLAGLDVQDSGYVQIYFWKNNSVVVGDGGRTYSANNINDPLANASSVVKLNAGDTIELYGRVYYDGTQISSARFTVYALNSSGGSGSGTDTLAGLSCATGEIAKWNGTAWACSADDAGSGGSSSAKGLVVSGSTTALATSVVTDITFNNAPSTNNFGVGAWTSNKQFTVPTGEAGWYNIVAQANINTGVNTRLALYVAVNGNNIAISRDDNPGMTSQYVNASANAYLAAGDIISLTAFQNSGSAAALSSARLSLVKLSGDGSSDTLSGLSCTSGQVAAWNGTAWSCADMGAGGGASVAFTAYRNSAQSIPSGAWTDLVPNTEYAEVGGDNFNTTTGKFTAPVAGYYQFSGTVAYQTTTVTGLVSILIQKDNAGTGGQQVCYANDNPGASGTARSSSCSGTIYLTAGEIVEAIAYQASGSSQNTDNARLQFSGFLIGGGSGSGSDTLAGLSCTSGQVAAWNGTAWSCADMGAGGGGAQVAFNAHQTGAQSLANGTWTELLFNTKYEEVGGNNYNTGTGKFTAPVAGYYIFSSSFGLVTGSSGLMGILIQKEDASTNGRQVCYSLESPASAVSRMVSCSGMINLAAGEVVEVVGYQGSGSAANVLNNLGRTQFSGALLGGGAGGDTLAGLSCTSGQVAAWNGTAWACANGGSGSGAGISAKIYASAPSQSIPASAWTNVTTLGNTNWDNGGLVDSGQPSKLVVPAGQGGEYIVYVYSQFVANATGGRWVGYTVNGALKDTCNMPGSASLGGAGQVTCAIPDKLNAGDVIGMQVYQSSGGALNINGHWLAMQKMGGGGGGSGSDTLAGLTCTDGQVAAWNNTASAWECSNGGAGLWTDSGNGYIEYSVVDAGVKLANVEGMAQPQLGLAEGMTWNPDTDTLTITGNITYTGTITDTSDRRLKADIESLIKYGSMLDRIKAIDTYSFRMKGDPKAAKEFGVMAQELEAVFPELVVTANDEMGTKSVNYQGLIAPMIEAVKELSEKNTALEAENAALRASSEARFADIEKEVALLSKIATHGAQRASSEWLWMMFALFGGLGGIVLVIWQPMKRKGRS